MNIRHLILAASALIAVPVAAQETYENVKLANQDLNGTARYVGMGGAMDALGADLSVINSNPAGIGLFRKSKVDVSFGLVTQDNGKDFANGNKTNASFDQAGFVYSMRSGRNSFLNFAFNYRKSQNFDYILSAAGALNDASQNTYSYMKARSGALVDDAGNEYITCSRLDELYLDNVLLESDNVYRYKTASGFALDRAHTGYIGEYDFNVSGNIHDRIYLGLTFGVYDVHYKGYSEYSEYSTSSDSPDRTIADHRRITGSGFDIKGGIIFRPIESSPFRIGLTVTTPTWYDLTSESRTSVNGEWVASSYDYKVYTPWKFGVSLGHTIGNIIALGAGYEYEDYGSIDSRINNGGGWDWYDGYYDTSDSDGNMNDHTEESLKGVSTLKLGIEVKPIENFAIRAGYNYQSAIYDEDAMKGVYQNGELVESPGIYYSSTMDYTNWKDTHRFTFGLGYQFKNFNIDMAYQYTTTKGDFHAFPDAYGDFSNDDGTTESITNYADAVSVKRNRHQVLLTLGYRF